MKINILIIKFPFLLIPEDLERFFQQNFYISNLINNLNKNIKQTHLTLRSLIL